jgi:glyoxylase-like metal-dependent hydrolase (beta-lactamase superfamily II)/rhodanese-related sulfurtransferase
VHIETIETPCLGNRSYVFIDDGHALVVDPPRDIERIEDVLLRYDADLTHVFETHRHADYVSGGLVLARRHRATYVVPPGRPQPAYSFAPAVDGALYGVGRLGVRVIATPGHTPHHVTYVVDEDCEPVALCTGGSLLNGSVGRTDLHGTEQTVPLAHEQWRSARRLAEEVPGETLLLPTHGFGSLCSAAPAAGTASQTLGEERSVNPALLMAERPFVVSLVAGFGAIPAHYARLPLLNAAGPGPVDPTPPPVLGPEDLQRFRADGHWLIDVRDRRSFASAHLKGSVNVEATGPLVAYLPWILAPGAGVVLLGDQAAVRSTITQLTQVGIDRPVGMALGTPWDWTDGDGDLLGTYGVGTFADLLAAEAHASAVALDVRSDAEWATSHVQGALHLALPRLAEIADPSRPAVTTPVTGDTHVYCGGGFRAAIAASLLDAAGASVTLVDQPYDAAVAAGMTIAGDAERVNSRGRAPASRTS